MGGESSLSTCSLACGILLSFLLTCALRTLLMTCFFVCLKANFDSDGDESITFDEFSQRVVTTVSERVSVGSIPRKDWTW